MLAYLEKLFGRGFALLAILLIAIMNWFWPFFLWFGEDSPIYRFIWLGIFFVLLDLLIEVSLSAFKDLNLIGESMGFSYELKKISEGFKTLAKVPLANGWKADFIIMGSSGIWLIVVQDEGGTVTFNGDDIVQGEKVIKGLLTKTLEKSYYLAGVLKKQLGRDIIVSPVLAFSSSKADLSKMPKMVRGVYITSRKDVVSLVQNTDVQLLDEKAIDEINELLKNPIKDIG